MLNGKLIGITLLLVGFTFSAWSQDRSRIDRLKKEIKDSGENIKKFKLLADLAFEYRFSNPDSTIYFCTIAQQLGEKLKLETGAAKLLNYIGVAYNYKGERLAAYEMYIDAMALAEEQHDTLQIGYANNNIGRTFFDQGLLSRSYNYFLKAISLFEAVHDSVGMAYGYQSMANLYSTQKDFNKGEEYFKRALAIRMKLGNTRDIMSAWLYIGSHYSESGYYDKATYCFLKADSGYRSTKDEINLAEARIFLAENYVAANKLDEADRADHRRECSIRSVIENAFSNSGR